MPVAVSTFEKALAQSSAKRHLLLGNGFSIALRPKIFSYNSLFERANFANVRNAEAIFKALDTRDFEVVIKLLMDTARLLKAYAGAPSALITQLRTDAAEMKKVLVSAIAENHPDRPYNIKPMQYASCRKFLSNFSHIYTLNYDVLLYWSLMQSEVDRLALLPDDGFRHPEDDIDAPYVSWQEAQSPTVHYLHGALHLFDAGAEIIKYTWSKTDVPIIDQIRDALEHDRYPVFVSEGDSKSKMRRIMHSAYLHKAFRSFTTICNQKEAAIFIFGHSLAENDDHIFKRISRGRVSEVFVSLYGDPNLDANKQIIEKAGTLAAEREKHSKKYPLSLRFYDSNSARCWG